MNHDQNKKRLKDVTVDPLNYPDDEDLTKFAGCAALSLLGVFILTVAGVAWLIVSIFHYLDIDNLL